MSKLDTSSATNAQRAARLKQARVAAGFRTAREASAQLTIPYPTYAGHENGSRGIKDNELLTYADAFKTSVAWLAFGSEFITYRTILPSIYFFERFNRMSDLNNHNGLGFIEVEAPFPVPSGVSVIEIPDDSLAPHYFRNELLLIKSADLNHCSGIRTALMIAKPGATQELHPVLGTVLRALNSTNADIQEINGRVYFNATVVWVAKVIGVVTR